MFEFLNANKVELIEICLTFIAILIVIFKKKVKKCPDFEMLLTVLPGYIREAESKYSEGTDKYVYVFNLCIEFLNLLTGDSKQRVIETYTTKINAAIENILSTPQKKGDTYGLRKENVEETK